MSFNPKHTSKKTKHYIIEKAKAGWEEYKLAIHYNLHHKTVQRYIKRYERQINDN